LRAALNLNVSRGSRAEKDFSAWLKSETVDGDVGTSSQIAGDWGNARDADWRWMAVSASISIARRQRFVW
jgi:hypothetical protein